MNIFQFILHITVFIDRYLVPLIFALAFVVFIWGVFTYFIRGGGDPEERDKGRKFIMWGLIGFVVMIAVWGLVNLLVNSLGIDQNARPRIPTSGGYEQLGGKGGAWGQPGQPGQGAGGTPWFNSWVDWGFMPVQNANSNTNVNGNANANVCQTGPTCLVPDSNPNDPCCN